MLKDQFIIYPIEGSHHYQHLLLLFDHHFTSDQPLTSLSFRLLLFPCLWSFPLCQLVPRFNCDPLSVLKFGSVGTFECAPPSSPLSSSLRLRHWIGVRSEASELFERCRLSVSNFLLLLPLFIFLMLFFCYFELCCWPFLLLSYHHHLHTHTHTHQSTAYAVDSSMRTEVCFTCTSTGLKCFSFLLSLSFPRLPEPFIV